MSIWKEIKYALNSTLGTSNFKSLDKMLQDLKDKIILKINESNAMYNGVIDKTQILSSGIALKLYLPDAFDASEPGKDIIVPPQTKIIGNFIAERDGNLRFGFTFNKIILNEFAHTFEDGVRLSIGLTKNDITNNYLDVGTITSPSSSAIFTQKVLHNAQDNTIVHTGYVSVRKGETVTLTATFEGACHTQSYSVSYEADTTLGDVWVGYTL